MQYHFCHVTLYISALLFSIAPQCLIADISTMIFSSFFALHQVLVHYLYEKCCFSSSLLSVNFLLIGCPSETDCLNIRWVGLLCLTSLMASYRSNSWKLSLQTSLFHCLFILALCDVIEGLFTKYWARNEPCSDSINCLWTASLVVLLNTVGLEILL